jgi:hypothetical protein
MMAGILRDEINGQFRGRGRRAGLTTMEFLGCVTAVLGGAWIGALYLGVDMQHLAHNALEQAQLLEKIPAEWRPAKPKSNVVTREQMLATLRKELGSLRSELIALRSGAADPSGTTTDAISVLKENTRAYWRRLSEIALNEEAFQKDAESAFTEANAAKVFAIKGRICRFAAKAVDSIPEEGVDELVVKFGRHLGLWYDRAGELYERATRIWETPTGQQARAQLNDEWKRAETQHRNEARLLNERAAAVRATISRQFGEEFPEFAKPVSAVSSNAANTEAEPAASATGKASAEPVKPEPPSTPIIQAAPVTPPTQPVTAPSETAAVTGGTSATAD